MEYTRGRIVLTYYLRFPLMGIALFTLYLVGAALLSGEPLLYELRVHRILPLIIGLYFLLFPLSLLIGFWVGSGYQDDLGTKFSQTALIKGGLLSLLYFAFLLALNLLFRGGSDPLLTLGVLLLGVLLGGSFSWLIARTILVKGSALQKDF